MNTLNFIGNVSLNLSSFLYLILLVPQIIHNRKSTNIAGLSLWLHFLLYTSYSFDLVYGITDGMPLQYVFVSIVGLILVITQHIQLLKFHIKERCYLLIKLGLLFIFANIFFSYYVFSKFIHGLLSANSILMLGVVARGCEIIYCVPQIFKNRTVKSAQAVSSHFICLNILLAILDSTAAWCLNWELPNKFVGLINIIIMLIIMYQHMKYSAPKAVTKFRPRRSKLNLASAA